MTSMSEPQDAQDLARRRRRRNLVLAGALATFVIVVYFVSLVRMGGG